MNKELKTKLHGVIESEVERYETLEDGSDEQAAAIENLNKLYKLEIEDNKTENEALENFRTSERNDEDLSFKKKDSQMKFIMDVIRVGAEVSIVAINLFALKRNLRDMYKFEETGTVCSEAGRKTFSLVPKLFKFK